MAVTIPGRGDLSPRRKHRNWRRRSATAAVVLVVARWSGTAGTATSAAVRRVPPKALPRCPSATPQPPAAQQARLTVRNATLKTGLAADVAHQLRQRDFRIAKVGNTSVPRQGCGDGPLQRRPPSGSAGWSPRSSLDATLAQVDGHPGPRARHRPEVPRAGAARAGAGGRSRRPPDNDASPFDNAEPDLRPRSPKPTP